MKASPVLCRLAACAAAWACAVPLRAADPLARGFSTPSRSARPETWFHLIGGNVAKPGLTADLEAIAGAGLDGIQLFHGQFGGPWPGVTPQVACLSPAWDDMISHVAGECRRLGLNFTMQNCPGWAMSGGPWIKPENAMRHLVWSRVDINGGTPVSVTLPTPQPSGESWRDYRDIAVLAFPTPAGDDGRGLVPVAVRSNREGPGWDAVARGAEGASVRINPAAEAAWVEVTFAHPVNLRSLELPPVEKLCMRRGFDPGCSVLVQAVSGGGLTEVVRCEIPRGNWQEDRPLTLALPDVTAASFRVTFENKTPLDLTVLRFSTAARVNNWQGQAGFVLRSLDRRAPPAQDRAAWVSSHKVVDVSRHLNAHGGFQWNPPAGPWTVLRFGHVNTGARNGPAPKEATGFECDKLSTAGADAHFAGYIGRLSAPGGPADGGRLGGMVIDSWECHTQTWTPAMEDEFRKWRGYPLRKWLPALAGWVMDDQVTSERFLRDWRATLNDLLVSNYYDRLAKLGRGRGMKLSFESGPGDVPTGDILQYYGKADIPMCEFWHPNDPHWGGLECKPMLPAVSAAHVYGKNRIAAESFTNIDIKWNEHPFLLKHLADRHFAQGLNHLVFHTYTHNPRLDVVPGSSFGAQIGTPFLRGQTWWPYMPQWTAYLSRCQFMLQQGLPVADVLWYLGDDFDHKPRQDAPFPDGYKFDYLNADALLHRLRVEDGLLKTPEGASWKVLWLPDQPRLTLPTLIRLRELIRQGAVVVGTPSFQNASLAGDAESDQEFDQVIRELWSDGSAANADRKLGNGRLLQCGIGAGLAKMAIDPDVTGTGAAGWCHRNLNGTDIYFIAADRRFPLRANPGFRSKGRPVIFDPLTGATKPVTIYQQDGGRTIVPVDLPAAGSVFVVFEPVPHEPACVRIERDGETLVDATDRKRVDGSEPQAVQGLKPGEDLQPRVEDPPLSCEVLDGGRSLLAWRNGNHQLTRGDGEVIRIPVQGAGAVPVDGPWRLSFPPGWDAPARVDLPALMAWSELTDPAARAFSGTADYVSSVTLDSVSAGDRHMIDLGRVEAIAEISVNGKDAAILWGPPFRADITDHVRNGENAIHVKVTSTWFNRLAHDASLPEERRKTWTVRGPAAGSPVQPAGLIGPVVLHRGRIIAIPE